MQYLNTSQRTEHVCYLFGNNCVKFWVNWSKKCWVVTLGLHFVILSLFEFFSLKNGIFQSTKDTSINLWLSKYSKWSLTWLQQSSKTTIKSNFKIYELLPLQICKILIFFQFPGNLDNYLPLYFRFQYNSKRKSYLVLTRLPLCKIWTESIEIMSRSRPFIELCNFLYIFCQFCKGSNSLV